MIAPAWSRSLSVVSPRRPSSPRTASLGLGPAERVSKHPLGSKILALLKRAGCRLERVGVAVISHDGDQIVSINASAPLKPASNMKILTTAAALHFLGEEHVFETRLEACAPIRNGVLRGDLMVHGTGDPNISGRFYDGDPLKLFRTWARQLHEGGLERVEGDMIVDDSRFDAVRFLPTWKRKDEGRWFSAEISPLTLNDNCVDVTITPTTPGKPALVEVTPCPSRFVQVTGAPLTVSRQRTAIRIHRQSGTNRISIEGKINRRDTIWKDHVTVHDPALFFAHALAQVMEEEGISIQGRMRRAAEDSETVRNSPPKEKETQVDSRGQSPKEGEERHRGEPDANNVLLVRHTSSLRAGLAVINKHSQNLHAEMLLKALGAERSGDGSVQGGANAIRRFLVAKGIAADSLEIADGSGLSHTNRVSARVLARVLHSIRSQTYYQTFRESLPVAGVDGTLERRFRVWPELVGKVHAKTGHILGASSLSGYVANDATTWTFSVLLNSPCSSRAWSTKKLQEHIVREIANAMPEREESDG